MANPLTREEQHCLDRNDFLSTHHLGELTIIRVATELSSCDVALQGAQVLSFIPAGKKDLLWVSPKAIYEEGKAIRGGIPVCLPWFGVNQRSPEKPKHGFARVSRWHFKGTEMLNHGAVQLQLRLDEFESERHPLFDFCFSAELTLTISESLTIDLAVKNCSSQTMPLTWALHSYHPVSDIDGIKISGLADCAYLDNTDGLSRQFQNGDIAFEGELDRAYLDVPEQQVIHDIQSIEIRSKAPSAVVWNPGSVLAATMSDVGGNNAQYFVCVERGAVFDNEVPLESAAVYRSSVEIISV